MADMNMSLKRLFRLKTLQLVKGQGEPPTMLHTMCVSSSLFSSLLQGILSLANAKANENDSHFSIMMGPQPHLDGKMTVFGEVYGGMEVSDVLHVCFTYISTSTSPP
jgi:cyclophilin family peptidyl-prolyl cis-trans isomerase